MTAWMENDPLFQDQLERGRWYERLAMRKLCNYGVGEIVAKNHGFRGDRKDIPWYTVLSDDATIKGWPWEFKSRDVAFTNQHNFPYEQIMVDTVRSFEEKAVRPVGYVCISQLTYMLIGLDVSTKSEWDVVKKHDRTRDIDDYFYVAPRACFLDEPTLVAKLRNTPYYVDPPLITLPPLTLPPTPTQLQSLGFAVNKDRICFGRGTLANVNVRTTADAVLPQTLRCRAGTATYHFYYIPASYARTVEGAVAIGPDVSVGGVGTTLSLDGIDGWHLHGIAPLPMSIYKCAVEANVRGKPTRNASSVVNP
jgi:hypothetical protein